MKSADLPNFFLQVNTALSFKKISKHHYSLFTKLIDSLNIFR